MYDETDETGNVNDIEAEKPTPKMGAGTILLFMLFAIVGSLLFTYVVAPYLGMD